MYGALHTLVWKALCTLFTRDQYTAFSFEKENPTNGEKDVDKPESL